MCARVVAVVLCLFAAVAVFAVTNSPVITSLAPQDTIAGTGQQTVEVRGANFISGAVVRVNSANRPTVFVDSGHLTVTLISTDVASPTTLSFVVANPSGGGLSSAVTFNVLPNSPAIASLDPATVLTGSAAFTLHVTGSNFASTAIVKVNNSNRTTTFIDSSHLDAAIPATDVSSSRTLSITVLNPSNKVSNTVSLVVSSTVPSPTISILNPNLVPAGNGAFDLVVTGKNYVSGAAVRVNGTARVTSFNTSTQLTARILSSDVAAEGSLAITVRNPDGKTSDPATLTVTAANQPQLTSISPNSVTAKSSAFTLTLTGSNFISGAKVNVNTAVHTTTFVSETTLTTTITASEITNPGQLPISVTNPGTGSPTSSSLTLTVVAADAPVISSLNPTSVATGSGAVNVIINGSGFVNTDAGYFNGSLRAISFVSATQVVISLTAADVSVAGQYPITVRHTTGTASTSAPAIFNVSDSSAGPIISTISPTSAPVNGAPFTLTINGTGFTEESIVQFDGSPRTTTFVSITMLTTPVFASDLSSARQIQVTVLNPGSPVSPAVPLTIAVIPPVITSISPATVTAGDFGFTLTVNGTGFSSSSVINVGGTAHLTQFDAGTGSISTAVLGNEIATPAALDVTVTDRGLTSSAFKLTVARPSITSLSPRSTTAGGPAMTLAVAGSNFLSSAKVVFDGVERTTNFDSASGTLFVDLTASDLANPKIVPVIVRNTELSESAPVLFSILSPGAPVILVLNPQTFIAGSAAQTLFVTGVNFLPTSRVAINGTPRDTTFVSGNELDVRLQVADLATAGALTITVINQDGTVSNPVTLFVTSNGEAPARRRASGH